MKRFLCMLLALCMAAAWLPAGVLAEDGADTELPQALSGTWVNPLYEGVAAQESVAVVYPHDVRSVSDMVYHTDPAAAGEEIRAAIENREEVFSVGYQIPYEDYTNEGLGVIASEIIEEACAHTGVPTQGDYMKWQYGGAGFGAQGYSDNDEKTAYNSVITFNMLYYADAAQEKAVTERVDALLRDLNPTGTDYEKLTTVYDWICDNVVYDYEHLPDPNYKTQYTAYGALIDGTSVCQGFSLLLYRLALEMGIDCRLVTGIGITNEATGPHAWNILKLGEKYYNADATWDINYAEDDDYAYYLLSEENFGVDHIRDAEFAAAEFTAAYPMGEVNYEPPAADSGNAYPLTGTCGDNLTWTLDEDGTLTISGMGAMANAEDYHDELGWYFDWKDHNEKITRLVVEEGVTTIAEGAFSGCPITTASLPDTLTTIGTGAFADSGLTSIEIPDSVTSLGMSAFYGCEALTDAKLPAGLQFAAEGVFGYCTSLTTVVMPEMPDYDIESQSSLSLNALFEGCSALTDIDFVTFPAITEFMFAWCSGLEEIAIPEGVEAVWSYAFRECGNLTSVTIPASVTALRPNICSGDAKLETIIFEGSAPEFDAEGDSDGTPLDGVTATAYYPANDATWTEEVMASYGGSITWVARESGIPGDLDGDGTVDDGDVAQLLWYTLFPESYTIVGNADFNGDGNIDDTDVAYLLWHTLFPDAYPLN